MRAGGTIIGQSETLHETAITGGGSREVNPRTTSDTSLDEPVLIIRLGASRGDAGVARGFLSNARPDCAYVIHEEDLDSLEIALESLEVPAGMTAAWATAGSRLVAGHVYVVPGHRSLMVLGDVFAEPEAKHETAAAEHRSSSPVGDRFASAPSDSSGNIRRLDRDADPQEQGAEHLHESSETSFREIAEATPAMMWSVGPDGSTWRNKGMRDFLGLTSDENPLWLGEAAVRFIHGDDRERIAGAVRGVLRTGEPWSGQYRLRRNDGEYRWAVVTINPLLMEDGSIHSVGVVQDIHDRLLAESALRELNQDLENRVTARTAELAQRNEHLRVRNEVLDQFAHAASHDLRAPLRTIRSYITLLEEELNAVEGIDRTTIELFSRISASAERMQRLLGALLRYSTVGRREFDVVRIDPNLSVAAAVADLHADIEAHDAVVDIDELPDVLGDQDGLTEVFNNVLSNSIRYRGDDPPRISITGSVDGNVARIEISDNGRGFHPRFQDAVFEPFRRLSSIEEAGSGLGLAICASIVERLGGKISARSTPGAGTTVTMELDRGNA